MGYQIKKCNFVTGVASLPFVNVNFTLSTYKEISQATIALRTLLICYDVFNHFLQGSGSTALQSLLKRPLIDVKRSNNILIVCILQGL